MRPGRLRRYTRAFGCLLAFGLACGVAFPEQPQGRTRVELVGIAPIASSAAQGASGAQESQQEQLEQEIERLLQQAETQRQQAPQAPELGAGLGARLSALNPNITVIGDVLGQISSAPDAFDVPGKLLHADLGEGDPDDFRVRAVELLATAAVDPFADALLKLDFGAEGVEVEEAYILFHDYPFRDRLPEALRDVHTKVGLFRMNLGPVNLTDEHDLPTVDRPFVQQRFFGSEGLIRPGLSFSKLLTERGGWTPELTVEFVNGQPLDMEEEEPPLTVNGIDRPLGLVHVKVFREWDPAVGWESRVGQTRWPAYGDGYRTLDVGFSFVATGSRAEGDSTLYSVIQGIDVMWTWMDPRPDIYSEWMIQFEGYVSELEHPQGGSRGDLGAYLLYQYRWARQWYGGLRFDATEVPLIDGYQLAATAYVTYFLTEFNRIRLQYQWLRQNLEDGPSGTAHSGWVQFVFAYGAHPPEPYYIRQRF